MEILRKYKKHLFLYLMIFLLLIGGVFIINITPQIKVVNHNINSHEIIAIGTLTSEETGDSLARIKIEKVLKNASQQKEIPTDVTLRNTNPFSSESPPISFTEADIGKKYLIYGRWTQNLKTPEISGIRCSSDCIAFVEPATVKQKKVMADMIFIGGEPHSGGRWGEGEDRHRRYSLVVKKTIKPLWGFLKWPPGHTVRVRIGGPYPQIKMPAFSSGVTNLFYLNKIEGTDDFTILYADRYPTAEQQLKILRWLKVLI